MDLSLYLVQKFCGRQTAVRCAKTLVLDLGRDAQTPFRKLFIRNTGLRPKAHQRRFAGYGVNAVPTSDGP